MIKKIGKKSLPFVIFILAVVVTVFGIASAEITAEELVLETGSEVVVLRDETLSGKANSVDTTFEPLVRAKIGGVWRYIDNEDIEWSQSNEGTTVAKVDDKGIVHSNGSATDACEWITVTGTYGGAEITYKAISAIPLAEKADLDFLSANSGAYYKYDKYYALAGDIDYSSETWHERYLNPIASYVEPVTVSKSQNVTETYQPIKGIYGDINPNVLVDESARFSATIDGRGYSLKNAVVPLGAHFIYDSVTQTIVSYYQNWIGILYGGSVKNICFDDLIYEGFKAAEDSAMYTVGANSNLSWLNDTDSDGKEDATGLPVVSSNGAVDGIDMSKIFCKFNSFYVTGAHRTGLIGEMVNGTLDNIYLDVTTHMVGGFYDSVSRSLAGGLLVANINEDASTTDLLVSSASKVKNCIVYPTLNGEAYVKSNGELQGEYQPIGSGYNVRTFGAIVGTNYSQADDVIEDCAIMLEYKYKYNLCEPYGNVGIHAYPCYKGAVKQDKHGLKNVHVFNGTENERTVEQFFASEDLSFDLFDGVWRTSRIEKEVFKGKYEDVDNTVAIFGKINNDIFNQGDFAEIGVRIVKDGDLYEFKFNDDGDKELRADGSFVVALKNLVSGNYRGYVYAVLADGTETRSGVIEFTSAR